MQVRLEVTHKKGKKKRVVLNADAVIGRSSKCNLRIASSQISRRHCKLTVMDSGVLVRDLESANGTYVDGKLIPPNQDVALTPGSRLAIGPVQFLVYYEASNPAIRQPGSTIDLPAIKLRPERSEQEGVDAPAAAADVPHTPVQSPAEEDVDDDEASATETVVVDPNVIQQALAEGFPSEPDDEETSRAKSLIDDLPETKELVARVDTAEEEEPDKAVAEMESLVSEAIDEEGLDSASIFDEAPADGDDAPAISAPDREESLEAVEEAEAVEVEEEEVEAEEEKPKGGSLFGGLFSFGRKRGRKPPDEAAPAAAAATDVEADKTAEEQDRKAAETAAADESVEEQPIEEPAEDEPRFDNVGVDVGDELDYTDADEEHDEESDEEEEQVDENLGDFFSQFEE